MIGTKTEQPAHAATFIVNSTDDFGDMAPRAGSCFTGILISGDGFGVVWECTLRATLWVTNASGNASFTFVPNRAVPVRWRVTATATGVGGTSEFSRARTVVRPVSGQGPASSSSASPVTR